MQPFLVPTAAGGGGGGEAKKRGNDFFVQGHHYAMLLRIDSPFSSLPTELSLNFPFSN